MPPRSGWEDFYREFRRLESHLSGKPESHEARRVLRRLIEYGRDREKDAVIEAKVAGFEPKLAESWYEIHELGRQFPKMADGRRADDPLEDVYCAAYSMRTSPAWQASLDRAQLYRGQRNHNWSVRPSLFRSASDDGILQSKLQRVRDFARSLQRELQQLDDAQAVAVAQHYSTEAKLQTWLIDVTWDPLVALFFASDGGQRPDLGVVSYYTRAEWDKFSARGSNVMGAIEVIDVPGIQRITAQRALFINTSHPEFFERLVPFSIWFKQYPGVVFEDETLEWPISRRFMYPAEDETRKLILRLQVVPCDKELTIGPRGNPAKPLSLDDYMGQAESWLAQEGVKLGPENYETLRLVCRFYSELRSHRPAVNVSLHSLHRLQEAFNWVVYAEKQHRTAGLKDAVKFTLSREMSPQVHELLEDLILELEVEKMMPERNKLGTVERLIDLINDVGPLHTVSGFGFGKSPDAKRDLARIKDSAFWTFLDFRGIQPEAQLKSLIDHWNEKVLVIAVEDEPSRPLYRLIKGMVDQREHFDFDDGVERVRRQDQSVVIPFPDAESIEDVSERYVPIPYWSFK
jgi:hypothetical protein